MKKKLITLANCIYTKHYAKVAYRTRIFANDPLILLLNRIEHILFMRYAIQFRAMGNFTYEPVNIFDKLPLFHQKLISL